MAANVQSMCQYWKNFNLQELQKELDTTATDLANRQDESDASRKRLVEQSREFKKNTPEDIRKIVAPLLKSFQAEVDSLSKRSKAAEGAILSVYKKFIDLPDPVEALDHALSIQKKAQRVQDLEIENKQLRDTLTEYNHEFAEVKNQEVTIKSLKDKLRDYEEKLESTVEARAKDKERELQRYFTDKERQLQETQLDVARNLGESEHKVSSLEKELDSVQSELFEIKSKYDETTIAKADEMEIVMADLDRANERAGMAEREVDLLRHKLSTATHSLEQSEAMHTTPDIEHVMRSNLEFELSAKEKQICQLVEDIQKLQASMKKQQEMAVIQITSLEEELTAKTRALGRLEEMLQTQHDYRELKRELEVLKSIEFPRADDDTRKAKSLEVLLLEKNKTLQSENTQLKVANNELNARLVKLQDDFTTAMTTVHSQKQLVSQLEEDLRSVNAISTMLRGDAEGEASKLSSETEVVAAAVKDSITHENETSASSSLLPIIQSQRERYRVRAQELEAQNLAQQQQLQLTQNEVDKLRSDNVKLYEKIKFLQSYPTKGGMQDDGTENRYSSQYEERLDPFTSFGRKERQRKYMDLKPYDKITLGMGRFIMGNKVARMVTFFYTLLLHCLVFMVLYKIAHTEDCKRNLAAECNQKFAEHMRMAHGDH